MRRTVASLALVIVAACGSAPPAQTTPPPTAHRTMVIETGGSPDTNVARGMELISQHRCAEAMVTAFEPALRGYERQFAHSTATIHASRTPGGALLSMLVSADDHRDAIAIGSEWPDTMYLEAFCLVELQRTAEAAQLLQRALQLIPNDVVYSCELGTLLQAAQRWDDALAIYHAALDNVEMLEATGAYAPTPEQPRGPTLLGNSITDWRRRSMRGIGYTLIEMHRLDEAEAIYHQILAIDPNDHQAQTELDYIAEQRTARTF